MTLLLLAGMGVRAAPASATFHLNKVNEVMLASSSGGASVQFVEFLDKGGSAEIFPPTMGPFKLVVYDAAGNKLGEHVLSGPALSSARAAGRPYLVSTVAADIAFGVTGDERLDVTLPQGAGQVCFVATAQSEAYSCLTWGRLTKAIPTNQNSGTGSANGAAPLPGQSAQRQPDDTIQSAPPTPKAANRAGTAAPSPTRRFAGMRVAASRVKVDRTGRARVPLRCPAGTNGPCKGRLTLRDRGTTIGRASFTLRRGRTRTVKVKLSRAARRKLARGGRLSARARVAAEDAVGQSRTTSRRVTLIRSGARAAAATVNVALGDGRVSPSPTRTSSRQVRFRARNRGVLRHEFVVIRTRRRASRLPVKGSRASERGRVGKIRSFSPGRTRTLSLRLKRGHYALICNLPGHYQAGVRADFRAG
ncbi:MAG TPA: hypothetical protein VFD31_04435 [Thermoleophilaceae bacterium]|nr:hypothetical protein [Thermoleophilaceae bacterium]